MWRFQSPQWGSNSKEENSFRDFEGQSFSPLNGEVILKSKDEQRKIVAERFQSPQWGSNSKAVETYFVEVPVSFQSPQWGSNSKG